jgi:pilus assembly protein CpaC
MKMHPFKNGTLILILAVLLLLAASSAQEVAPAPPAPATPVQTLPQQGNISDTQPVHILVGRSVIINMQTRLRRVLVSNDKVVDSVTASPTQLVITAKTAGTSSVILWDETGRSRILDVYSDVDVSGLRDSLQQAFPLENVQVEADQGRVVLTGTVATKAEADDIAKIAAGYSKDVVNSLAITEKRNRQILLQVKFAEVNRTKLNAFGINFISTGAGNTPGIISTQQFGPATLGGGTGSAGLTGVIGGSVRGTTSSFNISDLLNIFFFRPDLNFGATIKLLQNKNVLQVLAEPNLMSMPGEPARFLAGGEFPFPVVQASSTGNAVTIQFRPFGVKLDFVGTIGKDDVIRLKVAPEVSALDFSNALTLSGFVVPAISTRRAETQIELKNGQSFGIAGLLDKRTTAQMAKIPGIGDIPIIGQLFRSRSINNADSELLVLVTPIIVDPVNQGTPSKAEPNFPLQMMDRPAFDSTVDAPKNTAPSNDGQQKNDAVPPPSNPKPQ